MKQSEISNQLAPDIQAALDVIRHALHGIRRANSSVPGEMSTIDPRESISEDLEKCFKAKRELEYLLIVEKSR